MRKTFIVLLVLAALAFITMFSVNFLSDQVITDNLTGDALIASIQSKLNYNAVSFIALVVGGVSTLFLAILTFAIYIAEWSWTKKLP